MALGAISGVWRVIQASLYFYWEQVGLVGFDLYSYLFKGMSFVVLVANRINKFFHCLEKN